MAMDIIIFAFELVPELVWVIHYQFTCALPRATRKSGTQIVLGLSM